MKRKAKLPFDPKVFLAKVNGGRAISEYRNDQIVYAQGEPADSVFYIQSGKVKKTVVSEQGKEAVVALLGTGDFFGEGCLSGQPLRLATVSAMTGCVIVRIAKADITRGDPRRAGVCRAIYRAPVGSKPSYRRGSG
jgi:CRP/FNR family transcriptional regulator, cyclic AMP receptor protein